MACHRKLAFAFYTLLELETLCCCATTEILALSIVYHIVGIFDLHTHHTLRCPQIHNPGTGRAGLTKTDLLWLPRGEQAEAGSDADTELTSYSCSLLEQILRPSSPESSVLPPSRRQNWRLATWCKTMPCRDASALRSGSTRLSVRLGRDNPVEGRQIVRITVGTLRPSCRRSRDVA